MEMRGAGHRGTPHAGADYVRGGEVWMLQGLGLSDRDELVYTALLRTGRTTVADLGTQTGLAVALVSRSMGRLRRLGLATRDGARPVRYAALPPEVGLSGLLVQQQAYLQQAQTRVTELLAAHRDSARRGRTTDAVEVLTTADEVAQCVRAMERGARKGAQIFVRPPYLIATDMTLPEPARDVVNRFVYERELLQDARTHAEVSVFLAEGYQIKVNNTLPCKLILVDRELALVPMLPDQSGIEPGFLLLRGESVVTALAELFDYVWERATPMRLTAAGLAEEDVPPLDDVDVRLLTLMLSGLPDKAVASQLGTSLRTVQRRLHQLMELTGTTNRMQLGWHVARTGLI